MSAHSPTQSPRESDAPPRLLRLLYALSVPAAAAFAAWHGSRLVHVAAESAWLGIAAGCIAGSFAADLVTGAVHWACDTWGSERTPWVGGSLIRAFREHHTQPLAMLDHDWIEVNGEATSAATAAFALLALPMSQAVLIGHPFLYGFAASLVTVSALANQLHQWAHAPRPPRPIRALQRMGLVLGPARHARHHRGAHMAGYCITTGWMNPLLDSTRFWRAIEHVISTLTGAEPRSHDGSTGGTRGI